MTTHESFVRRSLLLLAAFALFVPALRASVVLNSTNFPDPIFRSYISGQTSVAVGGTLTDAILGNVYSISVEEMGIGSLKGIEHFPNLDHLNAVGNNLTEIDVSNNPKLTILYLTNNSLTSLDVSNNPLLTQLSFGNSGGKGNNRISYVKLTNNPKITLLSCSNCELTSLDVSNMPDLSGLYCEGNELATLNVTNNPKLIILRCNNNLLTYINLENNPLLENGNYLRLNFQTSTRRFQRMSYTSNENSCWALYVGTSDASRIKNLKIDGVSKTPVMLPNDAGWMMVSDDLKKIPLKVTYDYDTGSPNDIMMKNVVVNYHVVNYGVYVAGEELTSLNLNNIPGLKSGSAYVDDEPQGIGWAGNPTLVLYNAVIEGEEGINNQGCGWFKINVRGNNKVLATDFNALQCDNWSTTTLSGGGRLHVMTRSDKWHGVYNLESRLKITDETTLWVDGDGHGYFDDCGWLEIENGSTLAAYGRFYPSVELPSADKRNFGDNIAVRYPSGATIDGYHVYCNGTDVQREWVVIGPSTARRPAVHQKYGLQICGFDVDEVNANDIVRDDPDKMSGEISFDADTHTLSLKDSRMSGGNMGSIWASPSYVFPDIHIKLEGNNVIALSGGSDINTYANTYIEGPGKLSSVGIFIPSNCDLYIRDNCSIACNFLSASPSTSNANLIIGGEGTRVELNCSGTILYAIEEFASMTLQDGLVVKEPAGGYYSTTLKRLVNADGDPVQKVLIEGGSLPTAISQVETADDAMPIYNLQGQRVGNDYKGIVIKGKRKEYKH